MERRKYDIAFSLGFSCGTSQSLRAAGLQYASYPLDWLGVPRLSASVDAVVSGFDGWMEKEDFRLVDVSHDVGFCTRIYLNEKTGLGYSHEFSDFMPFDKSFQKNVATYARRVERFMAELGSAKRILAVYIEHATRGPRGTQEIREQLGRLRSRFPQAQVDLLYLYEDAGAASPKTVSDEDGLTIVAMDYRTVENGRATQFVKIPAVAALFRSFAEVPDSRTPEEKAKFAQDAKNLAKFRWGPDKGVFRRWLNHHAYKTYRTLERILRRRGLVHPSRMVWFWDEKWTRIHGPVP